MIGALNTLTTAQLQEGSNPPLLVLGARTAVQNELFNMFDMTQDGFATISEIAPGQSGGQIIKVVYRDENTGAAFRKIGEEYTPKNVTQKSELYEQKLLGGAFNYDYAMDRFSAANATTRAYWLADQINDKVESIINGFANSIIKGKVADDPLSVNGLDYYLSAGQSLANMSDNNVLEIATSTLHTYEGASKFEEKIRVNINKMKGAAPNVIITTEDGKTALQTVNRTLNKGIMLIKYGSIEYYQFLGLNIIALPDSYFDEDELAKGIPFYMTRVGRKGVSVVIPDDGQIIAIKPPKFATGKLVEVGSCEMSYVPVIQSIYCVSRCYIDIVADPEVPEV